MRKSFNIIFVIGTLVTIFYIFYKNYSLKSSSKYTISLVTGYYRLERSGPGIEFDVFYKSQGYPAIDNRHESDNKALIGKLLFAKFDISDPNNAELQYDYEIIEFDSTLSLTGWKDEQLEKLVRERKIVIKELNFDNK